MNSWEWWWLSDIEYQQRRTNRELQRANELQQQNNQLLEQIRRMQLTPQQRAAEDKHRAQLAARREAEAQLAEERDHTVCFLILCFITAVIGCSAIADKLQAHPAVVQAYAGTSAEAQTTPSPTPSDYAPRAELVRNPNK